MAATTQVKYYESKQTEGLIGRYVKQFIDEEGKIRHILFIDGKHTDIADSTFKRWWQLKMVDIVKQKSYYKKYTRNTYPLWDAVEDKTNGCLKLRDTDKNVLVRIYRSEHCFVVRLAISGKRYFTDIEKVANHLLRDQDIRTNEAIRPVIMKWGKKYAKVL